MPVLDWRSGYRGSMPEPASEWAGCRGRREQCESHSRTADSTATRICRKTCEADLREMVELAQRLGLIDDAFVVDGASWTVIAPARTACISITRESEAVLEWYLAGRVRTDYATV